MTTPEMIQIPMSPEQAEYVARLQAQKQSAEQVYAAALTAIVAGVGARGDLVSVSFGTDAHIVVRAESPKLKSPDGPASKE